jgi:hypothetical protein
MTNVVLAPSRYEDGFRRGIEWAAHAPEAELRELVECTRGRRWTRITVRPDWWSLRAELTEEAGVLDGVNGVSTVSRGPFTRGFVESASFLWFDPDLVGDEPAD